MKQKSLTLVFFWAILVVCVLVPNYDWFMNPTMTKMEVFLKWWPLELTLLICGVCIYKFDGGI